MTARSTVGFRARPAGATPRRRPVDWEGQEQKALMLWLYGESIRGTDVGRLYDSTYHVPNGGQRNKKTGADLKNQGVKAGVSDLVVMDARGGWHGLYLEFKATPPKNSGLSASQRDWLALADDRGYCAVLARGIEEARAVLRKYAAWWPTDVHPASRAVMNSGSDWTRG